jgi:hypothetical protein
VLEEIERNREWLVHPLAHKRSILVVSLIKGYQIVTCSEANIFIDAHHQTSISGVTLVFKRVQT